MDKFFHGNISQDFWFGMMGVICALALVGYVIFVLSFLAQRLNRGLRTDLINDEEVVRFNFSQLDQLKKK